MSDFYGVFGSSKGKDSSFTSLEHDEDLCESVGVSVCSCGH